MEKGKICVPCWKSKSDSSAVQSEPLVTTLTDITGFLVYSRTTEYKLNFLDKLGVDRPDFIEEGEVKISLLQAVEAPRVARGRGSHIT
jgi:hypothetical protein